MASVARLALLSYAAVKALPRAFITLGPRSSWRPASAAWRKRRRKADRYRDYCMQQTQTDEWIVFFGGKDYIPLFCTLTKSASGKRTVLYNSVQLPAAGRNLVFRVWDYLHIRRIPRSSSEFAWSTLATQLRSLIGMSLCAHSPEFGNITAITRRFSMEKSCFF